MDHVGGNGEWSSCNCTNPNAFIIFPCENNIVRRSPNSNPFKPACQGTGLAKNYWWDCVDLLNAVGLLNDHDLYTLRLSRCETYMSGFEGDINDGPAGTHPDANFCSTWKPYFERCLGHLPQPETMNRWGALMWRNRAAFDQLVATDNDCTGDARLRLVYEQLAPVLELNESESSHLLLFENGALAQEIQQFLEENNDGVQIMEILLQGMREGHFPIDDIDELISNMAVAHQKKDWEDIGNNRLETINQIENIRQYLSRRQTDYGDAAQYLESLLPHLIPHSEFTNEEVYRVYELAYEWYSLCVYNVLNSVVRNVIKAVRPFIEMALIESGFHILGNIFTIRPQASFRTISELPASVQSSTAQVWNRVAGTGANIPNTTIPNTFTFTAQNGQKFHVQFSATEHLGELVTQHGAATAQTWFQAQKGLRSQLVLDDFAKAVDEIVSNGVPVFEQTLNAGKWGIRFGPPASYSNGLPRIYHALSN